jgi:hypothetical protein
VTTDLGGRGGSRVVRLWHQRRWLELC